MKKWILWLIFTLGGLSLLAACGGTAATETVPAEEVPAVVRQTEGVVIAEAVIEPARWTELRFERNGSVVEVLVEEGDAVSQGDLLVRIDSTDEELMVQRAEAGLAQAEAQLAEARGWPRPEEVAVTEARLAAAQAALAQAAARRDQFAGGAAEADVATAQAAVASALAEYQQAYNLHERTLECFTFKIPGRGEKTICPALGRPEEQSRYRMEAAEGGLAAAEAQLEAAENRAEAQLRDAQAALWAAVAQRNATQALLDLQKAGSQAQRIAIAEAEVERAQASLAVAEAALEDTSIRAPFDGTVAELNVEFGDTVTPGTVLVVVSTQDQLWARTKDLTELDVVDVAVGQPVMMTLDALPDRSFQGHVTRVDPQWEDYRGDVTYPVIIELDEDVPGLRWGMTAVVEIEVE